MRNEKEMLDLILDVAKSDERIRAVYMNGSRTNPNVKKDIFQDYDIVYVVRQTKPFYENKNWVDIFGERLYMQCPEEVDKNRGWKTDFDKCFGWLMQFKDGVRMDLRLMPVEEANVLEDKLCVILLDKDGILPAIPEATDEDYRVKRPDQNQFSACCNEFWWCLNNVAKGLWREEIPYVHHMYYNCHAQFMQLINWKIGYETNFQISTGKASKYIKAYLSDDIWHRFLETYINGNLDDIWHSVFVMCELFHETSLELEQKWGLSYYVEEAKASLDFLKHVQTLPQNATSIFGRDEKEEET